MVLLAAAPPKTLGQCLHPIPPVRERDGGAGSIPLQVAEMVEAEPWCSAKLLRELPGDEVQSRAAEHL